MALVTDSLWEDALLNELEEVWRDRAALVEIRADLVRLLAATAVENLALRSLLDKAYRDPVRAERDSLKDELARYTSQWFDDGE